MYKKFIKRWFDFVFSLVLIVLLSPLLLIIALLVKIKLGSPVLFTQKRPGLNEKIFTIYKFRTMNDKKDNEGNFLPDSERLTSFGKFLRSTSFDELPELINILKGDMSFIGPRPLLVKYLSRYNEKQRKRHLVKPGLTGYAQINGRNAISWDLKFTLDNYYVDNLFFTLDLKILIYTVIKVINREGISSTSVDTMEEFKGSSINE